MHPNETPQGLLCVIAPQHDAGAELEQWFLAEAPQFHALMAQWARRAAQLENTDHWHRAGMRSCAEWFVTRLGFDRHFAEMLLRAGKCARELPAVGDAFHDGELSLEKVRSISTIATAEDQEDWVRIATESTPPQLARRCREARKQALVDDPEHDRAQRRQRHLRTWWDELNMFRISGALPSVEGAMVQIAIDRVAKRLSETRPLELDPPDDPHFANQADALVAICVASSSGDPCSAPASTHLPQLVVHVDYDVITGANPNGRGHIEDGPAISTATLRRLGCECTVKTLIERDGVPIAVGRSRREPTEAQKLAVRSRDRICRHPDCSVPASRCQVHHVDHWFDGGETELYDLCSLCFSHHQDHHDGYFVIHRTLDGDLKFVASDGRVIGTATGGAWKVPRNRAGP